MLAGTREPHNPNGVTRAGVSFNSNALWHFLTRLPSPHYYSLIYSTFPYSPSLDLPLIYLTLPHSHFLHFTSLCPTRLPFTSLHSLLTFHHSPSHHFSLIYSTFHHSPFLDLPLTILHLLDVVPLAFTLLALDFTPLSLPWLCFPYLYFTHPWLYLTFPDIVSCPIRFSCLSLVLLYLFTLLCFTFLPLTWLDALIISSITSPNHLLISWLLSRHRFHLPSFHSFGFPWLSFSCPPSLTLDFPRLFLILFSFLPCLLSWPWLSLSHFPWLLSSFCPSRLSLSLYPLFRPWLFPSLFTSFFHPSFRLSLFLDFSLDRRFLDYHTSYSYTSVE